MQSRCRCVLADIMLIPRQHKGECFEQMYEFQMRVNALEVKCVREVQEAFSIFTYFLLFQCI